MPAPQDLYKDPVLTDISVRYSNSHFIADQVFPTLVVEKETGFYFKFDKENLRKAVSTKRGDYARANRIDYGLTAVAYGPLTERTLEMGVPARVMSQYSAPLTPLTTATESVTEKVLLEKEADLAADMANASIVTQNVTLSGTAQWSAPTTSTPFNDIRTGITAIKQNGLVAPNVAVMGQPVFDQLVNHPNFVSRVQYSARADQATMANALADLIGVQKVFIGDAVQNTAGEGLTDATSFVWGKHFWLMYVAETPALETVSAGYHLVINDGRGIDQWYEQDKKTTFVRFTDYYDRKFVAVEAIYAILNAVA